MIEVQKISDSIGQHAPRLLTVRAISPKFVHQETLRHRLIYIEDALRGDPDFSFSVSSARAIPFHVLLKEVTDTTLQAKPVGWFLEQKGMVPGGEVSSEVADDCDDIWRQAALHAAYWAEKLASKGVHKSQVNRTIEPYIHVHCLMTATHNGWMNFFGLRLDLAADPTLRALAEACWVVWSESQPELLEEGQWHLPYIDALDYGYGLTPDEVNDLLKISAARCARLTYNSFETGQRASVEDCLKLYNRLVTSLPIHASPTEHQAQVDIVKTELSSAELIMPGTVIPYSGDKPFRWQNSHLAGNLGSGWIQHRKLLPGEALAALPEAYR